MLVHITILFEMTASEELEFNIFFSYLCAAESFQLTAGSVDTPLPSRYPTSIHSIYSNL